jgi:hypothetical protein
MAQTRSLTVVQGFNVPFGHRTLQVSGSSTAVESFAGSVHGGKYGVAGVLTLELALDDLKKLGVLTDSSSTKVWEDFEYRGKCYRVLELPTADGAPPHFLDMFIALNCGPKQN